MVEDCNRFDRPRKVKWLLLKILRSRVNTTVILFHTSCSSFNAFRNEDELCCETLRAIQILQWWHLHHQFGQDRRTTEPSVLLRWSRVQDNDPYLYVAAMRLLPFLTLILLLFFSFLKQKQQSKPNSSIPSLSQCSCLIQWTQYWCISFIYFCSV